MRLVVASLDSSPLCIVQATPLFFAGLDTHHLEVHERFPPFWDHPYRIDFERDSGKFQQAVD